MKTTTSVYVEMELVKKAKEKNIPISGLLEQAIIKALGNPFSPEEEKKAEETEWQKQLKDEEYLVQTQFNEAQKVDRELVNNLYRTTKAEMENPTMLALRKRVLAKYTEIKKLKMEPMEVVSNEL